MRRRADPCVGRVGANFVLFAAAAVQGKAQARLVAIGDVQGAFSESVAALRAVGLIDAQRPSGAQTLPDAPDDKGKGELRP